MKKKLPLQVRSITIDKNEIQFFACNTEYKLMLSSVKKIYINKESDFIINITLISSISAFFLFANYFLLNNIFLVNIFIILTFFITIKEFVIKNKSKYFLIIETSNDEILQFNIKSDLKYDAFYVKDQFYY
jgi:hypothetical protein